MVTAERTYPPLLDGHAKLTIRCKMPAVIVIQDRGRAALVEA